jgi:DNA-directed RNA polymerase subunit RPC12/RpoP
MEKLKVVDKRGIDKEEEKPPKQVPLRAIICPNCKYKGYGNQFLYNKQLNYTACPECGNMFMNPMMVKNILKQIISPIQPTKSII